MLFLNPWLLLALAGVSIPVIVHLIRRHAARPVDWGAMRFLADTLSERRRRIEWEDLLLMAARCLLLALAALAIARPFIPPDSRVPWSFVLPLGLLAVALFGASFVIGNRARRGMLGALALVLLLVAGGLVAFEHALNLRRFESSGRRDVAIVLDASTSMTRETGAGSLFDQALAEARRIVGEAPRGISFLVVAGGPAPEALSDNPLSHRADVLEQLDTLQPVGGSFRAHDALGVATLALAEGVNASKQLIVLTDGQRHGWRLDDAGAWQSLEEAMESLPEKPKLLLRRLPAPPGLRNAGIAAIACGRTLVGTDRVTAVRVEIENTGTEPVAPGAVTLDVDGSPAGREPLGLLVPGQTETVEFRHRFTAAGPRVVTARIESRDEIPDDDRADHVVTVREKLPVLVVDGHAAGSFLDRAGGPTALALAPTDALLRGARPERQFLMDPRVVAAADLGEEDIAEAAVVVLADVPRLPRVVARALADRLAAGGGLLVIAGPLSDPAFYNSWQGVDGPLLPLELGDEATRDDGVSPQPATFQHESLALFRDETASDLGSTVIRRWRAASERPGCGTVGGAFSNGSPLLGGRLYGRGRCLVVTCAFDRRGGNLPARTSFVPLVHELVSWTAGGGPDLNLEASWTPSVALGGTTTGGLSARYQRRNNNRVRALVERIDPTVDFDWGPGKPAPQVPADNFEVVWTGRLLPPLEGGYVFDAEVDDRLTVRIGDKLLLDASIGARPEARIHLEAGRPVPVEIRFTEDNGDAFARLFWTPPGGARELVPPSAWQPVAGPARRDGGESFAATDPLGRDRAAMITAGRRGRELRIEGAAAPGLYRVNLPEPVREGLPWLAGVDQLPVVVNREIAESRLDGMTDDDLAAIRSRIDTLQPPSADEVIAVLSGRGFGREITRLIAVAALLLLVLETALARWVSRSRRVAEVRKIDFGDAGPVAFGKGAPR